MKPSKAIKTIVQMAQGEAERMVNQARVGIRGWFAPGDVTTSTVEMLERQLQGARDANAAALADMELAKDRFDAATDEEAADRLADELASAKAAVARSAAFVDRAVRALGRHREAEEAARRTDLERRKAELETKLTSAAIEDETRSLEDKEAELLVQVVEMRVQRAQRTDAIVDRYAELRRLHEELGLDTARIELSISTLYSVPASYSRVALHALEEVARLNSAPHPNADPRRARLAMELIGSVIPQHRRVEATRAHSEESPSA